MYNRVCLLNPKSICTEDPMIYPPLGIWYVWAALERLGCEVDFVDLSEGSIPLGDYDAYMVTGTAPQASEIKRIGRILKDNKKVSFLGGAYAMTHSNPSELLNYYDMIVIGEIDTVTNASKMLKITHGVIRYPLSQDLSDIVVPCRKAAFRYKAFMTDEKGIKHRMTTIFTSRGCPFNCAFCTTSSIWGRKVRFVPVKIVEREINEIVNMGFTALMFYDDILPINKPRTLRILKILKKHYKNNGLISRMSIRTDVIRRQGGKEYLQSMHDAGVREVLVGVESASNRIKKLIHKGNTIEDDTVVLKWCKEIGISFKCSVVLGLPGETCETLEETRKWLLENRPDRVDVLTFIPFPKIPITENKEEEDIFWNEDVKLEEFWYKKRDIFNTLPLCWTSSLSRRDIFNFRQKLLNEIKDIVHDGKSSSYGIKHQ